MIIFLLSCLLLSAEAVQLPSDLSKSDRRKVVKTLGVSTSSKLLTNPYPLGGYSGFELGITYQFIDTDEIKRLGNKNETEESLVLAELTLGKGIYNNIDIFFHFAPFNHSDDTSTFGGIFKWGFYQAKFLPLNFSFSFHGSTIHIGDSFVNQNLGVDLITGVNVDNFSLYFGGGRVEAEAEFMGGPGGGSVLENTDPQVDVLTNTLREKVFSEHLVIGVNIQFSSFFLAAQIDKYREPVFSAKVGIRL